MPKSDPDDGPVPTAPTLSNNGLPPSADAKSSPRARRSRLHRGTAGDAPWAPLVRELASALALTEGTAQLGNELRRNMLTVATRRLRESAQCPGEPRKDET